MRITISKDWTPIEKIKIAFVMTDRIRDDINMERYGLRGRYNIQSIHEMFFNGPEVLESYRKQIEDDVNAYYAEHNIDPKEWDSIDAIIIGGSN